MTIVSVDPQVDERAREQGISAVDHALHEVSGRRFFTANEARDLLHSVAARTTATGVDNEMSHIIARAEQVFNEQKILDRDRVLDPLLDLRLILARQ